MALVGDVAVRLTAKTQEFVRNIGAAKDKYEKFGGTLTKVGKVMTVGVTGTITAATAAIGGMIAATTKAADEMVLFSQRTGISIETIQELKFAGDIAGVTLEQMSQGVQVMTMRMLEGGQASKDTIAAINKLGISVTDTTGAFRSQEDIFVDSVSALAAVGNATEQAALANEIFGRQSRNLGPLIVGMKGQLGELRNQARDLGLVMSEDAVRALDSFDDKMTILSKSIKKVGADVTIALLPVIEGSLMPFITDDLVPAFQKLAGWLSSAAKLFVSLST